MNARRLFMAAALSVAVIACGRRPTSDTAAEAPSVSTNEAQLQTTYWKLTALGTTPSPAYRAPTLRRQVKVRTMFGVRTASA